MGWPLMHACQADQLLVALMRVLAWSCQGLPSPAGSAASNNCIAQDPGSCWELSFRPGLAGSAALLVLPATTALHKTLSTFGGMHGSR